MKSKQILLGALLMTMFLGALFLFAPETTNAANMVVNGDFETGTISPWTTATNGGSATINSNVSFVRTGSFSGKITTIVRQVRFWTGCPKTCEVYETSQV
jgi:hypothetical protein